MRFAASRHHDAGARTQAGVILRHPSRRGAGEMTGVADGQQANSRAKS